MRARMCVQAAVKKVLLPVLPRWVELFAPLIAQPDSAERNSGLKINVLDVCV